MLAHRIRMAPEALARLAPAVERPGIHLGVWQDDVGLYVWGTTRQIPMLCLVIEVVQPGLLVIKHRRVREFGKFANIAVLEGDQVKLVDERIALEAECPPLLASLLGFAADEGREHQLNVLVQLAMSTRTHGHGGTLLIVPSGSNRWRDSIVWPVRYLVEPPYEELGALWRDGHQRENDHEWRERLSSTVEVIAGLTAVDGATLVTDALELLAFGAKIRRAPGRDPVERVAISEPVQGFEVEVVDPAEIGGTRHLSAAQFIHDQPDALALVASQDGRFTVFAWSATEKMVHAYRIEALLL